MNHQPQIIDGNEAAAQIAYKLSEVMAIYPITPSTPMGEQADAWSATRDRNLWGNVPTVIEMQSEAGAAGALHGALQAGALATTFTASQGLLLMLPNMYKWAGELMPVVIHVAARALAAQGLSIFGDHSDVMAARWTGFALLSGHNVQAAHDLALIAHAATLRSRVPFLHFFDGFRTSHELNTIDQISDDIIRAMIDDELIRAHRAHALSPERPVIRGTAQNPDVYFQARETVNPYYAACPTIVQQTMDQFAQLTGRQYHLFEYEGAPDAERVIVMMGSGAETATETARYLNQRGERVGVLTVHLVRPFAVDHFLRALPPTVRSIAVLDRCKEPGSTGEPLYLDIVSAVSEANFGSLNSNVGSEQSDSPSLLQNLKSAIGLGNTNLKSRIQNLTSIVGGRYGLASKEFTPAMVKAVFDELAKDQPKNHFTVGIDDDVTHTSLPFDPAFSIESTDTTRCIFWGLGSDGTVGANKDSIKIIGDAGDVYAQGYFVYDSKKSGSVTISHLRFGPQPIRAPYLITDATFVACHQWAFLERLDVLDSIEPGGTFLLNSPYGPEEVWERLPREVQQTIVDKDLQFYVVDANAVARAQGLGRRINRIMQTCFFALGSGMPRDLAIEKIKDSIRKTYAKRGEVIVRQNIEAVDQTLEQLYQVSVPLAIMGSINRRPPVSEDAPPFVRDVLGPMSGLRGDTLPVSALPDDGTYPTGTTKWEKRNIALEIPAWDPDLCIQCGKCAFVCPHSVIRMKLVEPEALADAPEGYQSTASRFKEFPELRYTLQVSPEDCTSCGLCVEACPAKDKRQVGHKAINMTDQTPIREREVVNWEFFTSLPEIDRTQVNTSSIKNSQLLQPMFEFPGACAGCGETPYLKLLSQLFGDRAVIANATGCSSIYGGNLPTTPWTTNADGRGPAWANSLFEDNAEFGLGMRVAIDQQAEQAQELLDQLADLIGAELVTALSTADQSTEAGIAAQRERVAQLNERLDTLLGGDLDPDPKSHIQNLRSLSEALITRSVWLVGGDGWAYDIGYGGLDHVLASGRNVNVLVLDTEVYSNTGGQASKSTPRGAIAKFAAQGKGTPKKDLALLAMSYGNVYVARIAMGANDLQTLHALQEAEAYPGPSLIIAYSHCIAHGYDLRYGLQQQKLAVQAGAWPMFRFNPARMAEGKNPMTLDSKAPSIPLKQFTDNETRYRVLQQTDPARADAVMQEAQADVQQRWALYEHVATMLEPTAPAETGS